MLSREQLGYIYCRAVFVWCNSAIPPGEDKWGVARICLFVFDLSHPVVDGQSVRLFCIDLCWSYHWNRGIKNPIVTIHVPSEAINVDAK